MLNRWDFRCVLKVENVRDTRRSTGRLFQAHEPATAKARSPMFEHHVYTAPEFQPWMQNVVDDVSLRPTAAGTTRTGICMQYMDMFMIIVWQSSQIWQITERSDRHTQLKTIPPRCYVVVIMMYICVLPQLGQRPKCPAVRDLCQRSPRCVRDTWSQRHGHHLHLVTTHDKFTYISRYSAKRHKKTLLGLSEQNFAPPNAWLFLLVVVCMP